MSFIFPQYHGLSKQSDKSVENTLSVALLFLTKRQAIGSDSDFEKNG